MFGGDSQVRHYDVIDGAFHFGDFFWFHRLEVVEIEAQPVRRDKRTGLGDVVTKNVAQRRVQKMRGRVVALGGESSDAIHGETCTGSLLVGIPLLDFAQTEVCNFVPHTVRVQNVDSGLSQCRLSRVADLSPALGIEHGLIGDEIEELESVGS